MVDQENSQSVMLSIYIIVMHMLSVVCIINSLVLGLIYLSCDMQIGTWLIVYGSSSIICYLIQHNVLKTDNALMEAGRTAIRLLLILVFIGLSSFLIIWTIYGAILLFCEPYSSCKFESDGQILHIVAAVAVVVKVLSIAGNVVENKSE